MKKEHLIDDWMDRDEVRSLAEQLLTPPREPAPPPEEVVYGEEFEGFADPPATTATSIPEAREEKKSERPEQPEAIPVSQSKPPPAKEKETPGEKKAVQANPFRKKGKAESPGSRAPSGRTAAEVPSPFRPGKAHGEGNDDGAPEKAGSSAPTAGDAAGGDGRLGRFVAWLQGQVPLVACLVAREEDAPLFCNLDQDKLIAVAGLLGKTAHRKGRREGKLPPAMLVRLDSGKVMQVIPVERASVRYYAALVLPRPLAHEGVKAFEKALVKALAGKPSAGSSRD